MSASDSQPPPGGTALDHPLPSGMRDLLPPESFARRAIANVFLREATLAGYELVEPPTFEYASTLERGIGALDAREIVRFVEPESGEVVALRPDVTPQIARLCATRLESKPGPYRLAYDARVVRRRSGSRARTHRQIDQLGVELVGQAGASAELEPLMIAARALRALGLRRFSIDLGDAAITRTLLRDAPPALARAIADALGRKDTREVGRLASVLPSPSASALTALSRLHGEASLLDMLPAELAESSLAPSIASLRKVAAELIAAVAPLGGIHVSVDLGEVRDLAYYTGPFFQILAEGPGVPIGGGGRYDKLLARFGRPLPATGMALDVDALVWALRVAGASVLVPPLRVVVSGARAPALAEAIRRAGIAAMVMDGDDERARAYAQAWDFPVRAMADAAGRARLEGEVNLADASVEAAVAALVARVAARGSEDR